jgi:hypothetical protein
MAGVPLHASHDASSAFAAMAGRRIPPIDGTLTSGGGSRARRRRMRVMIWTGSDDRTVAPANAMLLVDQFAVQLGLTAAHIEQELRGDASVTRWRDGAGRTRIELWVVPGMGHAWSGGSPRGSHTYPAGPRASDEMFAFFSRDRRRATALVQRSDRDRIRDIARPRPPLAELEHRALSLARALVRRARIATALRGRDGSFADAGTPPQGPLHHTVPGKDRSHDG